MAFNLDKFERADLAPRTERVPVQALADFFPEGEEAVFVVRGLTAPELYAAMEAGKRQSAVESIVEAIATKREQVDAIRAAIGMVKGTPGEIAQRLEMLVVGCVEPKLDLPVAVKLAEKFAVEFMYLTNRITHLTGQGAELVKPAAASQPTTV